MRSHMPCSTDTMIKRIRSLSGFLQPISTGLDPRIDPLPGMRAVLFDVYGTLLISGSGDVGTATAMDSVAAVEHAMVAAGWEGVGPETCTCAVQAMQSAVTAEHRRKIAAGAIKPEVDILRIWQEVVVELQAAGRISGLPSADSIRILAVEYECRVNPTWVMPGAAELLACLRERGLVLGIVSNAQFYTPLTIAALMGGLPRDLGFAPELCVWSYELGEAKPSGRMFDGVLQTLRGNYDISPAEVLYVGNDMLNDMWTASGAGCRTVLFAGDRRSLRLREGDHRCRELRPDAVVVELAQVADVCLAAH